MNTAKSQTIFQINEQSANRYTAFCLAVAAGVALLMWVLNSLGFFIVDKLLMNLAMPISVLLFLLPSIIIKIFGSERKIFKYIIMCCFLFGIGILSSTLTIQLVLAWACPIILSCHYYLPRFTHFTLAGVLILMLCSIYIGLYCGVWDANMMRSSQAVEGIAMRADFIRAAALAGDNILLRVFNFYYIPRAAIIVVVYLIGITLSRRTHNLLRQQDKDNREKERIAAELNVATHIQASMLPCIFPAFPQRDEFDIYAEMHPAKEVGGDFYDFFLVDDDHLALVMADVSGKGVPAALFMVVAKTLIKNALQSGLSPKEALKSVNSQLMENNKAEMFVTVWLGIYEISTGCITAANAGHEYPAICTNGKQFKLLKDKHGLVLAAMENAEYAEYELKLGVGDILFVYTDGVVEASNSDNALYGTSRMLGALNNMPDCDPKQHVGNVKENIDKFVAGASQFDDITMLCLKRKI